MILQEIIVRQSEEAVLYLRKVGNIEINEGELVFDRNAELNTNTYYNSFSIGKWNRYCEIEKINLHISYQGMFQLKIYYVYLVDDKLEETIIKDAVMEADSIQTLLCEIPKKEEGIVYFRIIALREDSIIYNAFYDGETSQQNDVVIALNICTYKREKYLLRNLQLLHKVFLDNSESPISNCLKIFITDNGNTLDVTQYSNDNVYIFHNPNVGGAGGFTRGLIEINKRKESLGITNAIFMDDDVEIEPEAILRTYRMLKILKKEYQTAFIGGAMLRLDMRYVQHENGALWNAGKCVFVNRGLDLRNFRNVVYNEIEQKRDYAAWWYCCIPASIIRDDNLPIPIFIHQDDTEFSLRNTEHIITMNGIAIWHAADDHTRLSTNEYYNLRNMMIVNAKYCPDFDIKNVKRQLMSRMLAALLRFRYRDMYLICNAIEDFCRGPEWLQNNDAAKLHKKLQEEGYRLIDVSEKVSGKKNKDNVNIIKNPFDHKMKRWTIGKVLKLLGYGITLNGWLLPAKKDYEIHYMNVHPAKLYRRGKIVLYDDASMLGVVVKRRFSAVFEFVKLYKKALKILDHDYEVCRNEYKNSFEKIHNISTWNRQLTRL